MSLICVLLSKFLLLFSVNFWIEIFCSAYVSSIWTTIFDCSLFNPSFSHPHTTESHLKRTSAHQFHFHPEWFHFVWCYGLFDLCYFPSLSMDRSFSVYDHWLLTSTLQIHPYDFSCIHWRRWFIFKLDKRLDDVFIFKLDWNVWIINNIIIHDISKRANYHKYHFFPPMHCW